MKFEKRDKSDEFAVQLLRADALSGEQADSLVDQPHLLKHIRARIETEKAARAQSENRIAASSPNKFRQLLLVSKTRFAIGFAAAAIFIFAIWQFAVSIAPNRAPVKTLVENRIDSFAASGDSENQTAKSNDSTANEPQTQTIIARVSPPTKTIERPRSAPKTVAAPIAKVERRFAARAGRAEAESRARKPQNKPREFYQLAFAGALEANETKQIVRVQLSPDALGTLGVAVPANAPPTRAITADLLLGEDGVPRAIRFVSDKSAEKRDASR